MNTSRIITIVGITSQILAAVAESGTLGEYKFIAIAGQVIAGGVWAILSKGI